MSIAYDCGDYTVRFPTKNKMIVLADIPIEFELAIPNGSAKLLLDYVGSDPETIDLEDFGLVPSLDVLFLLKTSHRFMRNSPHFWKTAVDWHIMKAAGAKIPEALKHVLKLREEETYTYKHPKLSVTKEDFFAGDQVPYAYDHDSLHEAVQHLEQPAYRFFGTHGEQVQSSKQRFLDCSVEIQLLSVLEESYVLAIERSQVPHPGAMTPKQSFDMALSKVCSSITSGWWREFAYNNIFTVRKMYSEDYMDKFKAGLANGTVKPYSGKDY